MGDDDFPLDIPKIGSYITTKISEELCGFSSAFAVIGSRCILAVSDSLIVNLGE